jgi:hypothetical protein
MTIILPAVAVTFAAFCVWLGVRVYNRRERWAKWTLVVVVGSPVLYVASFGPACWWFGRTEQPPLVGMGGPIKFAPRMYWPIGWLAFHGPQFVCDSINWYANLDDRCGVAFPVDPYGRHWSGGR